MNEKILASLEKFNNKEIETNLSDKTYLQILQNEIILTFKETRRVILFKEIDKVSILNHRVRLTLINKERLYLWSKVC